MDIIVDLQGFKRSGNHFVVKELGAVTIKRIPGSKNCQQDQQLEGFLFQPPFDWNELPIKYKYMNLWLARNYHGLSWTVGDYAYHEVKAVIMNIIKNKSYIYVKGHEKKQWIEKIIDKSVPVIDLERWNCPSLRKLKKIPQNCWHHKNHSIIEKYTCAYENVQTLKLWLLEQSGMIIPSFQRSLDLYFLINDITKLASEDIAELSKNFLITFESYNIDKIWDKLPDRLQFDEEIQNYRHCRLHRKSSEIITLIKNCLQCNSNNQLNLPSY